MEFKEIEKLIEKYLESKTTLKEEKIIGDYFRNNNSVSAKYSRVKQMFAFFEQSSNDKSSLKLEDITIEQNHVFKRRNIVLLAMAASIAILFSVFIFKSEPSDEKVYAYINGEPVENVEVAMAEAQKALLMISNNLNEGAENLGHLKEFNKAEEIMNMN